MMDHGSTTSHRRKKRIRELTEDVILSLPKNVIDAILIRLPLRDAVRTSILSHAWRYTWTDISEIVIDSLNCPLNESPSQIECDLKIINIVDQVLLLHRGPIIRFKICGDFGCSKHIDRWILVLSRRSTTNFAIILRKGDQYKVPSSLFLCEGITHLTMTHCILIPPDFFNGFNKIRRLNLYGVSCSDDGLSDLLYNCPLLNVLTLVHVKNCTRLHLSAPNLVRLLLDSRLKDICFVETPLLAHASISLFAGDGHNDVANGATCKLVKMLVSLPSISRMFLCASSLQLLSAGNIPIRLHTNTKLSELYFHINFENVQHMSVALCIFRSSPHLQKLHLRELRRMKYTPDEDSTGILSIEEFWKAQDYCNGLFSELKILDVVIYRIAAGLRFIELVLASAPVIQMVHVELKEENQAVVNKILKKLNQFRRLSSKVEVVIRE